MPRLASRIVTPLAILAVVTLAGCGSSTGPARTRYISQANAICRSARAQTEPLVGDVTATAASLLGGEAGTAKRLAGDLRRLHDVASRYLAELRRLREPSGDRAAIERFLTPLGRVVEAIGEAASAVGRGQLPQAIAVLQRTAPTAQDATAAAQRYGVAQCAKVLPALG